MHRAYKGSKWPSVDLEPTGVRWTTGSRTPRADLEPIGTRWNSGSRISAYVEPIGSQWTRESRASSAVQQPSQARWATDTRFQKISDDKEKQNTDLDKATKDLLDLKHTMKVLYEEKNKQEKDFRLLQANTKAQLEQLESDLRQKDNELKKYQNKLMNADAEYKQREKELKTKSQSCPDMLNLSEPNRPTKLAERFSELYDNEWTDCFVIASTQFLTEQSAIQMLLRTCIKIHDRCTEIASRDFTSLKQAFKVFSETHDDTLLIQMKQRRRRARQVDIDLKRIKPGIAESLTDIVGPDLIKHKHVHALWVKCLEICWLMAIQDQPIFMDTDINRKGQMFDNSAYRPYKQAGDVIEYIVWPALYIHRGGEVLSKGVAQVNGTSDSVGGKRR